MFGSIAAAIAAAFRWIADLGKRRERADAEKTGAIKQREADARAENEKLQEQLKDATDHRPGDGRRALRGGRY